MLGLARIALVFLSLAWATAAFGKVELPPLTSHVVDPSGLLSEAEKRSIDTRLEQTRRTRGFTIVALVVKTLDGEPIEDLAYRAFNDWQIGDATRDDGVLLVIAADEKRSRIETGKGIGGELTDLESAEVLREVVSPPMHAGELAVAVDTGTRAIEDKLSDRPSTPPGDTDAPRGIPWPALALALLFALSLFSPTARLALFSILGSLSFGGGRRGGGGGFGGGGGSSGGGGASGS